MKKAIKGFAAMSVLLAAALTFTTREASAEEVTPIDKGIEINETNFPVECMRGQLNWDYDLDKNGFLSDEENRRYQVIECIDGYEKVTSLKGLEHLKYITSATVLCPVPELDLSANPLLQKVYIRTDVRTKLNLGQQNNLETFRCNCLDSEILDLRGCPVINEIEIFAGDNAERSNLKDILVDDYLTVESLSFNGYSISDMDFSKFVNLKSLYIINMKKRTELDLSKNKNLRLFRLNDTLSSKTVFVKLGSKGKLTEMGLYNNRCKISVTHGACPKLKTLIISDNRKSISVSTDNMPSLKKLTVYNSKMEKDLNVSKNLKLKSLMCRKSNIKNIYVKNCKQKSRIELNITDKINARYYSQ